MSIIRRSANAMFNSFEGLKKRAILVTKLICHPRMTMGKSYYPELRRKKHFAIWRDHMIDAIKYGSQDIYYYEYGRDVKYSDSDESTKGEYVIYSEFMRKRFLRNTISGGWELSLLRNKFFFGILAKAIGIPTPEIVAYIKQSEILLNCQDKFESVSPTELVKQLSGTLYVKPLDGECGRGILRIEVNSNSIQCKNRVMPTEELMEYLSNGSFIIQKAISQHDLMNQLYPGCVNTIRMITIRDPKSNEIKYFSSYQRMGANGSHVDNTSQGGVFVGINESDGRLMKYGFFKPQYGTKTLRHPDTNVEFDGYKIPFFEEAKQKAILFHSLLSIHSIGWDIAITKDGPLFIEGNDNWEINDVQCTHGPMSQLIEKYF